MFDLNSIIEKPRRKKYNEWWNSPIETVCGYRIKEKKVVTHGNYVREFYGRLKNIIESKGYKIEDEKRLKSEVATFIYNLSDDNI